ncbi:MAG: hypothetical protein A2Z91_02740 [Deltaproteobacteria bacterium GWA2_38_16]|nr:MAG: hypothetical protein A2Z91_02740 [Deltaproteobacteria bacterium GWA2_38_16]OGQ02109.1 MAG: hypothetical protein A3D19_09040 [Deltaproteobacteria bacterium RIFCSPHIGHO2_02_FULL_38_15]OGQ32510.1 MAG: hypothetical protein A3A72_02900 [Deltaproteobacteria bacterium RIFCSPLOWO2_01_FULL_38_9]OGQ59652.1 MAG: hypothetical protein A3G92_00130 [Deltaproteobacteria bacterium RIFCSPLOWO2_12_FULL_38_8]HBQ21648.1 hypothetical protein [Deltaproteobacteria bacterium]
MKRLAALSGIILSLISISVFADSFEDGFYYLDKTQIEKAWTITGGSKDVKIGMISTGANYKLDSLRQNIDLNTDEISANGIDDDHNGYVDDVFGINTNNKTSDPMDYHGIGSFITGLVGGTHRGMLKNTSMVLANPLNDQGGGDFTSVIEAIQYVVSRGAKIIDLGVGPTAPDLCETIASFKTRGILFVSTAGNGGYDLDPVSARCVSDNMLVVATSDEKDQLAFYSNWGKLSVHVAAPGTNISGYNHLDKQITWSGGSFSTAIVSAIAALALSINPTLAYQDLIDVIVNGVDVIPALQNKVMAGGRVNAYNTVRLARSFHP